MQSLSWTLHEAMSFDAARVISRDWAGYPILRFPELPDSFEVHVINRPGQRPLPSAPRSGNGIAPRVIY